MARQKEVQPDVEGPPEADEGEQRTLVVVPEGEGDRELLADMEEARQTQKDLITKGSESLEGLLSLADQAQHPRGYEVLSQMLRTMSEMNRDFVNISVSKADTKRRNGGGGSQVLNQSVNFIGSTKDLQEMLKGLTRKSD